MILNLIEKKIKDFIESLRPPKEIRDQMDFGYSFNDTTAILFEIRPNWMQPENEKIHIDFAKLRYYKSQQLWKLYWMRASGKWELYEPHSNDTNLDSLLKIIKEDKHACFFG